MYFTILFAAIAATLPFVAVANPGHGSSRLSHRSIKHLKARSPYTLKDTYQGQDFFSNFDFFTDSDPTGGMVNFLSQEDAANKGLAYVQSDNTTIMKVDDSTSLANGQNRNSVRITSKDSFTQSLIISSFYAAPHGCSVWPAYWLVGPNWPNGGEIDVIEYVNEAQQNQVTVHTGSGCTLDTNLNGQDSPTGIIQSLTGHTLGTQCASTDTNNAGCAVQDVIGSAGHEYNMGAGAFHAVLRTDSEIAIWAFPRGSQPADMDTDSPDPTTWGKPTAYFSFSTCSPDHFGAMSIVFDITVCGGWANGAFSDTCSGDCSSAVMDPSNFVDAHWEVDYVKIFTQ